MEELKLSQKTKKVGGYDIPRSHKIYKYDPVKHFLTEVDRMRSDREKKAPLGLHISEKVSVIIWEPGCLYVHALNESNAWKRVKNGKFIFPNK